MLNIYDKSQADLLLDRLRLRSEEASADATASVSKIIADVRARGDEALADYTKQFDGVTLKSFWLEKDEIDAAKSRIDSKLLSAMYRAADNIRRFHEKQIDKDWVEFSEGRCMGQRVTPLRRVGVYAPGGTAAYPSTVLMTCIPATVAGVGEIILATPPKSDKNGKIKLNDAVLTAASIAHVDRVLTVGGAQAIAAMAYGTQSVPRVDKIAGPGNIYVTEAKKLVWGNVDIDMIAGPSEVLVIADGFANPRYIAADLLSQAEHDPLAASVLVTVSRTLAEKVNAELEKQLEHLERSDIARSAIQRCGAAIVFDSLDEAAAFSDEVAPEHLELAVSNPHSLLGSIRNAGSVFLGEYTPEPLGDYFAGPNHVLPTAGTARFSSVLSVDSFVKRSSFLYYDKKAFNKAADDVIRLAEAEGLGAHANSVKIRLEEPN